MHRRAEKGAWMRTAKEPPSTKAIDPSRKNRRTAPLSAIGYQTHNNDEFPFRFSNGPIAGPSLLFNSFMVSVR
jgi:hypothetical protein